MKPRMTGLSLLFALLSLFLFAVSVNGNETAVTDIPPVHQQEVVEAKGEDGMAPDRIIVLKWL